MGELINQKQLRENVRLLIRKLGVFEKSEVSCCGVTLAQCHTIVEIGRSNGMSLNKLAEMLNLDNSTMSRTINNLVTDNLVEREIDSQDRRYVTIKLTENGDELFKRIEESMGVYYKLIYESIPEAKRPQVIESLQLLLEAVDKNK